MKTFDEIIEVIKDYLSNQTRLNSYMPLTGKTREGLIYYGGKNEFKGICKNLRK